MTTRFLACAILALAATVPAFAGETVYRINFSSGETIPTGFTNYKPANFHTLEEETWPLGDGLAVKFDAVDNYTQDDKTNPLIAGGLFVTPNKPSPFRFMGLPVGSKVTLYAIDAWNEHGRAALVNFGGNLADTAQSSNDGFSGTVPGQNPTEQHFVLVAQDIPVGPTGELEGSLQCQEERPEGQLGGFILIVKTDAGAKPAATPPAPTTPPPATPAPRK